MLASFFFFDFDLCALPTTGFILSAAGWEALVSSTMLSLRAEATATAVDISSQMPDVRSEEFETISLDHDRYFLGESNCYMGLSTLRISSLSTG